MGLDMYACAVRTVDLSPTASQLTDMPWEAREERESKVRAEEMLHQWRGWYALDGWMKRRWLDAVVTGFGERIKQESLDPSAAAFLIDYFRLGSMTGGQSWVQLLEKHPWLGSFSFNNMKLELTANCLDDLISAVDAGDTVVEEENFEFVRTTILDFVASAQERIRVGDRIVYSNSW